MKTIDVKFLTIFLLSFILFSACKKEEKVVAPDVVTSKEYEYNTATKSLSPEEHINVQIQSEAGVKSIYSYLIRGDKPDSLISTYFPSEELGRNDFLLTIPVNAIATANLTFVEGIKIMVKRMDNSSQEEFVKISSFTPATPKLTGFPESVIAENRIARITGVAASENGIKKIEILDDAEVTFKSLKTIEDFNGEKTYNLEYDYAFRTGANTVRIILTDNSDYTTQINVKVETSAQTGPYRLYENVTLNAQGVSEGVAFIAASGTLLGACDLPSRGIESDIMLYVNTAGVVQLYATGNMSESVRSNYKCNDLGWTLQPGQTLKATKLRILSPTNTAQKRVIDAYAANSITDMSMTGVFAGAAVPTGNTAPYNHLTSANFDLSGQSLIWLLIPGSTPKNALLKIKAIKVDGPNSSVTMDIIVEN